MGHFARGDVIIAQVPCFGRAGAKLRPAVVVGTEKNNNLLVVPVSSQPSTDSPSMPLSLDDFLEGGLDMSFYPMSVRSTPVMLSENVAGSPANL